MPPKGALMVAWITIRDYDGGSGKISIDPLAHLLVRSVKTTPCKRSLSCGFRESGGAMRTVGLMST